MESEIILKAKAELIDSDARKMIMSLNTRIETINERTKNHTIDIRELRKEIKKFKLHIIKEENDRY